VKIQVEVVSYILSVGIVPCACPFFKERVMKKILMLVGLVVTVLFGRTVLNDPISVTLEPDPVEVTGSRRGDSLALVAIVNANSNVDVDWHTSKPLDEWEGIGLNSGRIDSLSLIEQSLSQLPPEIRNLTSLRILNLSVNQIKELPSEIGELKSLQEFYIYENELEVLPVEIGNLTSLKIINLSVNQIKKLPPEIGNLKSLQEFGIYDNELETLPAEIGNLTSLVKLVFPANSITTLPQEFGNLVNLEKLNFFENSFNTFPIDICKLKKLKNLDVSKNKITSIPPEIGNLINLVSLDISENLLSSLPVEISNLTNIIDTLKIPITEGGFIVYYTKFDDNYLQKDSLTPEVISWLEICNPNWLVTQNVSSAIGEIKKLTPINQAITLTSSTLNLSLPNTTLAQITLFNLRGQQLQTQTLQLISGRASVNLKGLKANGVYLAKVVSESGTISRKFRVER
jgi:hypothetical protein